MKYKKIILLSIISATALLITACGGEDAKTTPLEEPEVTSNSYIGAGSKWDVTLNSNNTFNIKYSQNSSGSPIDMDINGTYITLPSNFKSLTVTSATSPSGALTANLPANGDTAYGLEVSGYAFVLKPTGSNEVISMVNSSTCPTTSVSYNYVTVKSTEQVNDPTDGFFGKVTYDPTATANQFQLLHQYALTSNNPEVNSTNTDFNATCANGIVNFTTDNNTINMYLTQSGGAIVHSESNSSSNDEIYFGLPIEASAYLADLAGVYSGIIYDNDNNNVNPIKLDCDVVGVCIGSELNITTDSPSSTLATITFTDANSPRAGFFKGSVNGDDLICGVDLDAGSSGKNVINCISDDNSSFKNAILIER